MKMTKVEITNYKSFYNQTDLQFSENFNVIIGKNDSGKTALSQILSLKFVAYPHLSLITSEQFGNTLVNPDSYIKVDFQVEKNDAKRILSNINEEVLFPQKLEIADIYQTENIKSYISKQFWPVTTTYKNGNLEFAFPHYLDSVRSNDSFAINPRDFSNIQKKGGYRNERDVAHILARELSNRIYLFRAERFHVGQSEVGAETKLKPDASNLPEVLTNIKTSNDQAYIEYLERVQLVFPEIKAIYLNAIDDKPKERKIYLSNIDPTKKRNDLAIPLQDSGTGIGQVLAILFVVVTSTYPQIFIIDEPQSFLHPGAIRRLFSILHKWYPQHQYLITTHSPAVLSAADPENVILLNKIDNSTTVKSNNKNENEQMQNILANVGASLTDVFGADNIIWVEGKTEETCMKEIISKLCISPLLGTDIISIVHTGDFEQHNKKSAELTIKIYERLSKSTALIPPAISFVFDREGRNDEEIADLERRGKGEIKFIKRRMFENYLLNPEAIFHFISTLDGFSSKEITADDINNWIAQNKWNKEYFSTTIDESQKEEEFWITKVHGAKLLDDMFNKLSEQKYTYMGNKALFGYELTIIIIDNSPDDFQELVTIFDEILEGKEAI